MRRVVGVSQSEMARRLGTDITTVLDLESGAVNALPQWTETVRIVQRYGELSQIDPAPILSRLAAVQSPPSPVRSAPIPAVTGPPLTARRLPAPDPAPPPALVAARTRAVQPHQPVPTRTREVASATHGLPPGFDPRARDREMTVRTSRRPIADGATTKSSDAAKARRRRRRNHTLVLLGPMVAVSALFAAMHAAPLPFYSAARVMPALLQAPLRGMVDLAVIQSAPVREGLRWIEMDDPRVRKGDRLAGQ